MKLNSGCSLSYEIFSNSTLIFNISVCRNRFQTVLEENLQIQPDTHTDTYISPEPENRYIRVNCQPGKLNVSYRAVVELADTENHPDEIPEIPPADLPLDVLPYLYPSRYCESDRLMRFVQAEFGSLMPGYSRVTAMCNWIFENISYLFGITDTRTSAFNTVTERAGVCRDFAHLGIAFCRALNIPARFVTGYAFGLQPSDFHAYFEAYLGNRWYLFDATWLVPRTGLIRIGTGRDAADVSFATIFGNVSMERMDLFVNSTGPDPVFTNEPIACL